MEKSCLSGGKPVTIWEFRLYKQLGSLISHLIYYCLKRLVMQQQPSFDQDLITIKPRDFKCPCGKTYLSYAALFTHIKQKHDGIAPGKIIKPPSLHEKRGRPPVKPKSQKKEPEKGAETEAPQNSSDPLFPPESPEQRLQRENAAERAILELSELLSKMPTEPLNKAYLNEIEVFSQMNVYLNTRTVPVSYANGNICIADGFIEFAHLVCSRIVWAKFEPFYLLFMLFLQYIIDEENSKKCLSESNMDLFCQYINQYVEDHMVEMAEYYQFENHWIVQKANSVRIFYYFFEWCTGKRYITYKINMNKTNEQVHNPEQQEQH